MTNLTNFLTLPPGGRQQETELADGLAHLRSRAHSRPSQQVVLPGLHVQQEDLPKLLVWHGLPDVQVTTFFLP